VTALAAAASGMAPVTLTDAESSTMSRPPPLDVDPLAPSPWSASTVNPVAVADPFPLPGVADPDPAATVVWSGVPLRNVWDAPGAMVKVWDPPTGAFRVTLSVAGVSDAVTWPVPRSRVAATADGPPEIVSSGPPPDPRPTSRLSCAPLSCPLTVAVVPVTATLEVDVPRSALSSDVRSEPAAFATAWSTVPSGVPPVGSAGSAPSTPCSPADTALPGSTGMGNALVEELTPRATTWPVAVAVGSPVPLSEAEAELQAIPRLTSVLKGAGKGTAGCAQLRPSCWDAPELLTVAVWPATAAGVSIPLPRATVAVELPAAAEDAAPTSVVPPAVIRSPAPVALSVYAGPEAAPAVAPLATPNARYPSTPSVARDSATNVVRKQLATTGPLLRLAADLASRAGGAPFSSFRTGEEAGPCGTRRNFSARIALSFPMRGREGSGGTLVGPVLENSRDRVACTAEGGAFDGVVDLSRDRLLVERGQAGDRGAVEELYRRYHRRLYHFCLRRLHDCHDAEDAAQEAFTRAWRALPGLVGERRFYPWLTVIAANICTDMVRRQARQTPVADVPLPLVDLGSHEIDERLIRDVDGAMALRALDNLSERHQRVLRLREGSGWSTQQIAQYEGVAVPAAETLLWRARQALKREFAALADTGSRLGAVLGLGVLALRRQLNRVAARVSGRVTTAPVPSLARPGTVATSLLLLVGTVGGAILVTTAHTPRHGDLAMPAGPHVVSARAPTGVVTGSPMPEAASSPGVQGAVPGTALGHESSASSPPSGAAVSATGTPAGSPGGSGAPPTPGITGTSGVLPTGLTGTLGGAVTSLGHTLGGAATSLGHTLGGPVTSLGHTLGGTVTSLGHTLGGTDTAVTSQTSSTGSGTTGGGGLTTVLGRILDPIGVGAVTTSNP